MGEKAISKGWCATNMCSYDISYTQLTWPFFGTCLAIIVFGISALGVEQSQRRVPGAGGGQERKRPTILAKLVSSPVPSRGGGGHSSIPNLIHGHGHCHAFPSRSPHPVPTAWATLLQPSGWWCLVPPRAATCGGRLWQQGEDSEWAWTSRTCLHFGVHPPKTWGRLFLHLKLTPDRWRVFVVWSKL